MPDLRSDIQSVDGNIPAGVSPKKWARLETFLGALPPAAASRLFGALEASGGGEGLPAGAMLNILRGRLIAEDARFPARPPTAARRFFAPIEDFFIAHRRGKKRRARIDRASLAAIWSLILNDSALADARRAAAGLDASIRAGEEDVSAFERALFAAADEGFRILIGHAQNDAAFRADLEGRLAGGDEEAGAGALEDLAEISLILPAVPHLAAARAAFPRPVRSLTEEQLFEARRLYAAAFEEAPEAAPYVLLAVAARMDAPWRALRLYYHLREARDDRLPSAQNDAALIADALFEDLESLARALERDAEDDPDTEEAPARLSHFADFAAGLAAEADRRGDGAVGARVEACRDIAALALSRMAELALARVRKVHLVRHAGGSSRLMALRPDIARPLDRGAERAAREGAAFLARAVALGEGLDRPEAAAPFVADAVAESRRYAADLIAEIRAAEGEARARAKKRMEGTLLAAGPLLPQAEIALLKERAAAASVSA